MLFCVLFQVEHPGVPESALPKPLPYTGPLGTACAPERCVVKQFDL